MICGVQCPDCGAWFYARGSMAASAAWAGHYAAEHTRGPVGPDCRDGKHRACDGRALDVTTDQIVGCACPCHQAAP